MVPFLVWYVFENGTKPGASKVSFKSDENSKVKVKKDFENESDAVELRVSVSKTIKPISFQR